MQVEQERRRERQQVADQVSHLLGFIGTGHAVADQRLVHVDPEQTRLGVRDLAQRLAVDVDRPAGTPRAGSRPPASPAMKSSASRSASSRCSSRHAGKPSPRQMRSISAGSRPVRSAASASVYAAPARREQLRHVAERQPAVLARIADVVERVAVSRRRATIRACAAAACVQRPRYCGITPCSPQRRRVAGETPASRAAWARLSSGSRGGIAALYRRTVGGRRLPPAADASAQARDDLHFVERRVGLVEVQEGACRVDRAAVRAAHRVDSEIAPPATTGTSQAGHARLPRPSTGCAGRVRLYGT